MPLAGVIEMSWRLLVWRAGQFDRVGDQAHRPVFERQFVEIDPDSIHEDHLPATIHTLPRGGPQGVVDRHEFGLEPFGRRGGRIHHQALGAATIVGQERRLNFGREDLEAGLAGVPGHRHHPAAIGGNPVCRVVDDLDIVQSDFAHDLRHAGGRELNLIERIPPRRLPQPRDEFSGLFPGEFLPDEFPDRLEHADTLAYLPPVSSR